MCPHNQLAKYLELPQNGKIMAEVSSPTDTAHFLHRFETDPFLRSTSGSTLRAALAPSRGYATTSSFPRFCPTRRCGDTANPWLPWTSAFCGLFVTRSHPRSSPDETHTLQSLCGLISLPETYGGQDSAFSLCAGGKPPCEWTRPTKLQWQAPRYRQDPCCARLRNNWADTMTRL